MKNKCLYILLICLITCCKTTLTTKEVMQQLGKNPYIEIDGQPSTRKILLTYEASDIATFSVYKLKSSVKKFGPNAEDGAISIQTISYATEQFETLFSNHSEEYKKLINHVNKDELQYILNGQVLVVNPAGTLVSLDKRSLKEIKIIHQKELADKYQIENKTIGIAIKARKSKK
ncbi:MAG: hypothetical protein LBQ60_11240 [Bacteroidales bacterium]|nr:hypothetical protein [Bacteroidales bacterium]